MKDTTGQEALYCLLGFAIIAVVCLGIYGVLYLLGVTASTGEHCETFRQGASYAYNCH